MAASEYLNYLPEPVTNLRGLSEGNIDLIELTAFDVQIALTQDDGVQLFQVLKIMTEFMNEEFALCLASDGSYAIFDTVILLDRSQRRELMPSTDRQLNEENGQTVVGELFTAPFKGAALFTRLDGQLPMPASVVEGCQRQAFLEEDALLEKLQNSGGSGLGLSVVDVRAYINPYGDTQNNNNNANSEDGDESGSLEIVIIIAIVIACVAFLFLVFAIYWAWRYDKKNRDAYLADATSPVKSPTEKSQETFDAEHSPEVKKQTEPATEVTREEVNPSSYPSVIGGDSVADGVYTDSVISEDINSSLSQYYQTGLASYSSGNGRLQDAGSVSSMESYGYSLDGYAPSLATNTLPADATAAMSVDGSKRVRTDASAASNSKVTAPRVSPNKKDP